MFALAIDDSSPFVAFASAIGKSVLSLIVDSVNSSVLPVFGVIEGFIDLIEDESSNLLRARTCCGPLGIVPPLVLPGIAAVLVVFGIQFFLRIAETLFGVPPSFFLVGPTILS